MEIIAGKKQAVEESMATIQCYLDFKLDKVCKDRIKVNLENLFLTAYTLGFKDGAKWKELYENIYRRSNYQIY